MANEHPFQLLFESFGRLPSTHAESVNRSAYEALTSVLEVPVESSGRCILLRAPRAGHGKTHLLSRVQHVLGGSHEFIPLQAAGTGVDSLSVTEDALKRLTRPLPAAGGLTVLDLVVRRLFAFALQPLVISGEVPCQDREGALSALKSRPVETFDFHHPNAVTAHWAKENFEVLGPRLSMELAQRSELPIREVSFWVNAFFRYAATPVDHPGRAGALGLEVAGEAISEGVAMERLIALLAMLSMLMRVVLVADDLEGFSADETAALKFAAFIGGIRQAADRVEVILSLNKDVWENAFVPRLSGGLADRLSEVLIELEPLKDEDIIALFDSRAPGLGQQVLDRVDVSERHARGLIRAAGAAWVKAASENLEAEAAPAPAFVPEVEPEPTAKMEAALEVEMARELVDESSVQPFVEGPGESFPVAEFTSEPVFAGMMEKPIDPPFFPPVEEPTFHPVNQFQPVFEPVADAAAPPVEWGIGPAFEGQVVSPSQESQLFSISNPSEFQSSASAFQPVASELVYQVSTFEPGFQPVSQDDFPASNPSPQESSPFIAVTDAPQQNSPYPSNPFEAVAPPADFVAPVFTPPSEPVKREDDDADRVDDLLKQFRERYGRGGS